MPILRTRLSRREEAEDRRYLGEMHHEGVDVEIPDDSPECAPALDISVIGGTESLIFNLPSGLPGYAIALRLVAGKSGLILHECARPASMTKLYSNVLISEDQSVGLASASFPNRKY